MKMLKNYPLKRFTTLVIGGQCDFFVSVKNEEELQWALKFAKEKKMRWYTVGEGSNLIVSDKGVRGVVIKNEIRHFKSKNAHLYVGAGNSLLETIFRLNRAGFGGMERMAGIPGTVGGAIYGCAGAYGQEIKDHLVSVRIWDGRKFRVLTKAQCGFRYRESAFKKNKSWIISEAIFRLGIGDRKELVKTSREIIKLRAIKYRPGLKCPGSFFKNIKLSDFGSKAVRRKFVKKIDSDKIMFGKVPAGHLLEAVQAKGMRQGSIRVANHHANLIYNPNGGKARDVKILATRLKNMVRKKFGIKIEEEVQYLGF